MALHQIPEDLYPQQMFCGNQKFCIFHNLYCIFPITSHGQNLGAYTVVMTDIVYKLSSGN